MEYLFFCIELTLCTVVAISTRFYDISNVTFPWQHNGLQAFSIQKIKSEFFSFKKCYLLLCLFRGCELIWTYTAQAQESLLDSGATNKAFFILGR